jgi:Dyp-type peroxidase family
MGTRSTGTATATTTDPAVDHDHVQGNILRGYRLGDVRYFTLAFTNAAGGRSLLKTLITGTPEIPAVETASEWSVRPTACLNVGLTYDGVRALGLPDATLAAFPEAFRSGSAQRSKESVDEPEMWRGVGLGDIDDSAPEHWIVGGPNNGTVHLVVSVFTDEATTPRRDDVTVALRAAFAADGVTELSTHDGHTFPHGGIHFGYRDGISQPQVTGRPGPRKKDMQPWTRTGDFLLGRDYKNIYGGNFLGDLPPAIGDNGTYMVFRILRQDVQAFHDFTVRTGARFDMDPELVAAKMLGRWPNGVPLAISPDDPDVRIKPKNLNRFDHAATVNHPTNFDDADGLRCPFGAHMRRMNPRGGPVIGMQHNHRIIRRGVPYGPEFDPKKPDDIERGLLGAFFCGDLANQFEFLMKVWCNLDFSAPMLRGTRDPIIGYQPPSGGRFKLPTRDTRGVEVTNDLPRLVHTRGSLYLFVPGIGGLRTLAQGSG